MQESVLCMLDQPGMNARYMDGTHECQWKVGVQLWIYFNIFLQFMQYLRDIRVQCRALKMYRPHKSPLKRLTIRV